MKTNYKKQKEAVLKYQGLLKLQRKIIVLKHENKLHEPERRSFAASRLAEVAEE